MSSSPHIDNKKKDILILGKCPTQELEDTLTSEKMHSLKFTETNKNFCLNLQTCIITEQVVIYLLLVQKFLNLKQMILRLWQLCNNYLKKTLQKTFQSII